MSKNTLIKDKEIIESNKSDIQNMFERLNMKIKDISIEYGVIPHRLSSFIRKKGWIRDFNNKNILIDLHFNKKMKVYEMAEKLNCSVDSIRRSFRRFDMKVLNEVRYGSMSRYSFKEDYFETIDTEKKAYWLGFILADGCITHTYSKAENNYGEKRYDRLLITLAKRDHQHLVNFAKDIGYDGIVETGESYSFDDYHEYSRIRITSEKLCSDLIDKNIYPNKSTLETPYSLPKELKKHYFRGYFDGDGYVSIYKRKSKNTYSSEYGFLGSFEIVDYFKKYLVGEGIQTKSKISSFGENLFIFRTGGYDTVNKFYEIVYKDSSRFLERKEKELNYYITHRERYSPSFAER